MQGDGMKYRQFLERSQAAWEAQRARLAEALALTERVATEGDLERARDVLAQPIEGRQKELFGGNR